MLGNKNDNVMDLYKSIAHLKGSYRILLRLHIDYNVEINIRRTYAYRSIGYLVLVAKLLYNYLCFEYLNIRYYAV